MAGVMDWLGNLGTGTKNFINEDPDRFSILAGNLGSIIGQGNKRVEALGQFGAGLGTTGKIQDQREAQDDKFKTLLGLLSGPDTPGLTSLKADANNNVLAEISNGPKPEPSISAAPGAKPAPGVMTPLSVPGEADPSSVAVQGSDMASQLQQILNPTGAPGGASPTSPKPQASPSTPQGGGGSSILQALEMALGAPGASARWLSPELATQMMSNDTAVRGQALNFANAMMSQEATREGQASAERISAQKNRFANADKVPSYSDPVTGELRALRPGEKPNVIVPASQLTSAAQAQQGEARQQMSSRQSRFQDLQSNYKDTLSEIAKRRGTKATSLEDMFSSGSDWFTELDDVYRSAIAKSVESRTTNDWLAIDDMTTARAAMMINRFPDGFIPKSRITDGSLEDLEKGEPVNIPTPDGQVIEVVKEGNKYRILGVR